MRTLLEDGILKAAQGLTTLEDIVRVVAADDAAAHKEEATKPGGESSPAARNGAAADRSEGTRPTTPSPFTDVARKAEIETGEPTPALAARADKAGDSHGKQRVLVVEDSRTIAAVVKYFLELEGFQVLLAEDGNSGLEAAKREQPDVIVTDYNMPGMDGMTMVKALRADAATRDIAVLMLTSEPDVEKETQAFEAGADDYVLKPVEPRRLAARVKSLLTRSQRRHKTVVQ
jgi:PleD family two-component response regulator